MPLFSFIYLIAERERERERKSMIRNTGFMVSITNKLRIEKSKKKEMALLIPMCPRMK